MLLAMKAAVTNILVILPCCCWLANTQWTYRNSKNSYRLPSLYDPLEVVDFELMTEPLPPSRGNGGLQQYNVRNFGGRNKYDLMVEPEVSSRNRNRLPLLSRGERDLEEEEDGEEEGEEEEPSCQELRKMWRIARRIHNKAIKTNKIPQDELHPFSSFESDR